MIIYPTHLAGFAPSSQRAALQKSIPAGRPRALQYDGRYGGTIPVGHLDESGYVEIEFQLQVYTSSQQETFNVYEGEAESCSVV